MASSQGTARSGGTARAPADMARKNMRPGRPDVISTGTMQDPALTAAFRDWPAAVTGCALLATTRDAPTAFSANSAARTHPGAPWPISALADFLHGLSISKQGPRPHSTAARAAIAEPRAPAMSRSGTSVMDAAQIG